MLTHGISKKNGTKEAAQRYAAQGGDVHLRRAFYHDKRELREIQFKVLNIFFIKLKKYLQKFWIRV